ncbi:MAG: hypothetical protein ACPLRY_07795 [Candidatus Bathyarchaeales archaeon]
MHYHELNVLIRKLVNDGFKEFKLQNVCGQRYIGAGLNHNAMFRIYGTPGNDLGAFVKGPQMFVYGNVQDGCGNTMNDGLITVYGYAGDVAGYAMRGGKIFIRGDVGYRAGIHMKGYQTTPVLVVGGCAGDFLGEYMAGGIILVLGLGLNKEERYKTRFVGTGMHGGVIYIRGETPNIGKSAKIVDVNESDLQVIHGLVKQFCDFFNFNFNEITKHEFTKIVPLSHRPYGKMYMF